MLKLVKILLLEYQELLSLSIDIDLFEEVDEEWLVTVVDKVDVMACAMVVAGRSEIEQLLSRQRYVLFFQSLIDNHIVRSLNSHCVTTGHMIDNFD